MLEGETAAIIAGASAIGGGLIVAASNYVVTWKQAHDARAAEVRRTLIELLDVLTRVQQRLRLEPRPGRVVKLVNDTMAKRLPHLDHSIGLARRRLLDPRLDELSASLSRALSAAVVVAPLEMLPALSAITELMERADECDDAWWAQWNSARTDYTLWCRELAGSGLAPTARDRLHRAADSQAAPSANTGHT
jgi:hypothetical protein